MLSTNSHTQLWIAFVEFIMMFSTNRPLELSVAFVKYNLQSQVKAHSDKTQQQSSFDASMCCGRLCFAEK